ncbi:Triosephosphate isomerase [Pyronema omphalodes]|nr:Triosephosphate isomerase [Pyronema omphalodes]
MLTPLNKKAAARTFFIGGNFKSNLNKAALKDLVAAISKHETSADVVISPPALYLLEAQSIVEANNSKVKVAAQNISGKSLGAFTGEIAAEHLLDVGIEWTILGHSERRSIYGETDEIVAEKTVDALKKGLSVILCCGETEHQRFVENRTKEVVTGQLGAVQKALEKADLVSKWEKIVIAYEPVWAIGTGKTATTQQAQDTHEEIRAWLQTISQSVADATRILYGGSVNNKNSDELAKQKDIDGFLVGGASLKAETFLPIIDSAKASQ